MTSIKALVFVSGRGGRQELGSRMFWINHAGAQSDAHRRRSRNAVPVRSPHCAHTPIDGCPVYPPAGK
jgi:hypothetical protein